MVLSQISTFLKNHGWLSNLIFVFLCMYSIANTVNALVARELREPPTNASKAKLGKLKRGADAKAKTQFSHLSARNLFGAEREVLNPVEVEVPSELDTPVETSSAGSDFDENELKDCTLSGTLRGTLVANEAPEWSMAVFYSNADKDTHVYTLNSGSNDFSDGATLVDIRRSSIVVRKNDHFELCNTESVGKPGLSRSSVKKPSSTSSKKEDAGNGVQKVSDTEYRIERREVDDALSNLSKIATQARIVPSFKNGKSIGFKLFSIKPGSIYSKLGMKNGDVIQKINGYEINSPDKALEIYQKLRDASSVNIDLLRRGQSMQMGYNIDE